MGIFQTVSTGFFNVCSALAQSVTRITECVTFIIHLNYTLVTNIYTSACYVSSLIFTTLSYVLQAVSTVGLYVFDFLCEIYACGCALLMLLWRICVLVYKVFCLIFAGLETLLLCVWNGGVFTYKTLQQSAADVMETCESTTDYVAMLAQDFLVYICDTLTSVGTFSTWVIRGLWVGIGYVPYTASCVPSHLSKWLAYHWNRLSSWVSFAFMGVTQETYIGIAICCLVYMLLSRLVHQVYCRGFSTLFSFRRRRQSGAERVDSLMPVPFDRDFESDLEDDDLDVSSHEASDDDDDDNDNNHHSDDAGEESDTHTELTLSDGEESGDDAGSESDVSLNSQTFSSEDSDHEIDVQLPASGGDTAQHSRCSTPSRHLPKDMNPDQFERELERERDKRKCVVCQDWNKSVLVLPCKHMCLCVRCANHIVRSTAPARRLCPLCRSRIERVMDVFV